MLTIKMPSNREVELLEEMSRRAVKLRQFALELRVAQQKFEEANSLYEVARDEFINHIKE